MYVPDSDIQGGATLYPMQSEACCEDTRKRCTGYRADERACSLGDKRERIAANTRVAMQHEAKMMRRLLATK